MTLDTTTVHDNVLYLYLVETLIHKICQVRYISAVELL